MRARALGSVLLLAGFACNGGDASSPAPAPPGVDTATPPAHDQPAPKPPIPDAPPKAPLDPVLDPYVPTACTGAPGSIYELSLRKLDDTAELAMCRFEGKVLLIVNTASYCGYTPEYGPLEVIYDQYKDKGFYVLGFPSKSFNQEQSNEHDISTFCTTNYHITFPMFAIGNVNAPDEQPLYTWLKSQPNMSADVAWNFEKFLVGRDGKVVQRYLSATYPDDPAVTSVIEAELAKPAPAPTTP